MMRQTISVILLILAGCSQATPERQTESGTGATATEPEKVVASLSCRVNGQPMEVALCFASDNDQRGGSLKISSNGAVKQYTEAELLQPESNPDDFFIKIRIQMIADATGPAWQIPLTSPFQITAQGRGDPEYVLRLTIRNGDKTIFQDEASDYGAIRVDSESLS